MVIVAVAGPTPYLGVFFREVLPCFDASKRAPRVLISSIWRMYELLLTLIKRNTTF